MCYPQLIPRHITVLYVFTVINLAVLLNLTLVSATVLIKNEHNKTINDGFADLVAQFGPPISDEGVWGHLMYADPNTACKPIQPPPEYPVNQTAGIGNKWIALIKRGGDCSFTTKVLNAQDVGYIAVIVFNDQGDTLVTMRGDGKNVSLVHIPSVFIGQTDGLILRDKYNNKTTFTIVIDDDSQPITYGRFAMVIFYVFGTIIAMSFLTLLIIGVVKWVRDVRRRRRSRLSKQHLKKIPIHKFKKGDPYDVCAICLDEYEEGDKLRVLPCNHAYHQPCIDPWLTKNKKTCPICKQRVIPGRSHDSDSDSDSDTDEEAAESDSENTPLLGGARNNNNRPRGDTFDRSGIPGQFRPRVDSEDSRSDTSTEPMGGVLESSVEVHSEPEFRSRPRPPKRRAGLNSRYTRVADYADEPEGRPTTAPPLRPRPARAWEFGISPANSPGTGRYQAEGATAAEVGGAYAGGYSDDVMIDVDDVAPPRAHIAYVNPALVDSLDDHIESHMDRGIENRKPEVEPNNGARPRTKTKDSGKLLTEHRNPTQNSSNTNTQKSKSKKNRSNNDSSKKQKSSKEKVPEQDVETAKNNTEFSEIPDPQDSLEAMKSAEPGNSGAIPKSSDTHASSLGAIAPDEGAGAPDESAQAPGAVGGVVDVEVIRPSSSSRHKKKSKKKRRSDEEA